MKSNSLFENSQSLSKGFGSFVLSSNYLIAPLIARGCLFPPVLDYNGSKKFPEPISLTFVEFQNKIPRNLTNELELLMRNTIPIAIELNNSDSEKDYQYAQPPFYRTSISLNDVKQLVFRTRSELDRFVSVKFENVKFSQSIIPMNIDPNVFEGIELNHQNLQLNQELTKNIEIQRSNLKKVNSFAGFCCLLIQLIPKHELWFELLANLMNFEFKNYSERKLQLVNIMASTCLGIERTKIKSWEDVLIFSTVLNLLKTNSDAGWASKQILTDWSEEFIKELNLKGFEVESRKLKSWSNSITDVITNKNSLPNVYEEGNDILTTLMLLIVRGDSKNLLSYESQSEHTEEKISLKLLKLLIALRNGLRGIPFELKVIELADSNKLLIHILGEISKNCMTWLNNDFSQPSQVLARVEKKEIENYTNVSLKYDDCCLISFEN